MKRNDWLHSMEIEMTNLLKNSTWDVVDKPADKNILGCKWVFKVKKDGQGNILKYKSRLMEVGKRSGTSPALAGTFFVLAHV